MSAFAGLMGVLLPAALKVTVLLALAAAVERSVLRRRGSAAARHLLWTCTLVGALLLPVFSWALPGWGLDVSAVRPAATLRPEAPVQSVRAPLHPHSEAAAATPAASSAEPPALPAEGPPGYASADRMLANNGSRQPAPAAAPRPRWLDALVGVYMAGALLLLAKVAAEQLVVRRFARGARPAGGAEWNELLRSVAAVLGVRRDVVLLRSDAPTMPLTWGVFRPFVLIPTDADEWSPARRQAVLLHEMAHVARHDCLTQTLAAVACALYWPHPGVWWAARRLRVEQELACDDQVLARGIAPHAYAGHLLAIARARLTAWPGTALAMHMAAPSHLELRIRAAVDRTRARTAPGKRAAVLSAFFTAALLLPLSAIRADGSSEGPAARADGGAAALHAEEPGGPSFLPTPAAAGVRPDVGAGDDAATDEAAASPAEAGSATGASSQSATKASWQSATEPSSQTLLGGTWSVRLAEADEARTMRDASGAAAVVHVALRAPGLNTFYVPLSSLEGLTAGQVASSGAVRFRLRKDAGTFGFEGEFRDGRGSGRFDFAPDPAFAETLAGRGLARPTPEQQFSLARHDVGLDLLDELAAQGYAQPTTETLVRVGMTGVDVRYVREMAILGYRLGTVEALVRLSNQGIGPSFVRELAAVGYTGLEAADLLRLRNSGADADFVRRMTEQAGRELTPAELVELRSRGGARAAARAPAEAAAAAAASAAAAAAAGAAAPAATDASTPLEGRWVVHRAQGASTDLELFWTDNTNWRRWIATAALRGVSAGALSSPEPSAVSFRIEQDAGIFEFEGTFGDGRGGGEFRFRPDRQFASTLRSLGVEGAGSVTDHQLKNFAYGGISAGEIREFRALGLWPLTLDDALRLAIYRANPDYVRGMQSAGVSDANTVRGVVDMRIFGVTVEYARELAALGYGGLAGRQLIEMWRGRVTPEFVRSVGEAGYAGVAPEALIAMRRRGIEETARREGLRRDP